MCETSGADRVTFLERRVGIEVQKFSLLRRYAREIRSSGKLPFSLPLSKFSRALLCDIESEGFSLALTGECNAYFVKKLFFFVTMCFSLSMKG